MAAVCSLIFFAVLIGLAIAAVWGVWTIVAALVAKRKVRAILFGLPLSFLIVVSALAILMWHASRPTTLFEREFGLPAPADVTFVKSSSYALGDTGTTYLHFNASQATLTRIIGSAGLAAGAPNFSTNARPDWFVPPPSATQVYSSSTPKGAGGFSSEMRIIKFDPATGDAWYEFVGID